MIYGTLQVGRGIAAMLVVLFHASGTIELEKYFRVAPFGGVFGFGYAGVDFFFVLSGFIIMAAHAGQVGDPQALLPYLRKRIIRVYPTYWVVFALISATMLIVPVFADGLPKDWPTAVAALLLVPLDKSVIGGTGAPVVVVAWSLQYEIAFYIVFGVFICSPLVGAGIVALIAIASVALWGSSTFPASFIATPYPAMFAMGAATAWLILRGQVSRQSLLLVVLGSLIFFGTALAGDYVLGFAEWSYAAGSALIVYGLVSAEAQGYSGALQPKLLKVLGDASYSIYLVHFPVISAAAKVCDRFLPDHQNLAFVIVVVSSASAGLLFHWFVEKPIMVKLQRKRMPELVVRSTLAEASEGGLPGKGWWRL